MFVEPKEQEPEIEEYTDEYLSAPYDLNAKRQLVSYTHDGTKLVSGAGKSIEMQGVILGGCLDVLANLVGTRFDRMEEFVKNNREIIWFLEACDLTPMSTRRAIWNLKEAGWFDTAYGFVIGRPRASWKQSMLGVDQYNAVTDVVGDMKVPVVMDAEIGHIDPMLPVVMGATARVDVKQNDLSITYL
jgi:muramoyltetrapeptide carboxypeptidase LdcA involved in peptidoglycan recycling